MQSPTAATTPSGSSSARPSSSTSSRVGRRAGAPGTAVAWWSNSSARTEEVPRSRASTRDSSTSTSSLGHGHTRRPAGRTLLELFTGGGHLRRLVLWDVDGTLVNYAGLGWEAFLDAFLAVVGRPAAGADGGVITPGRGTHPEIALHRLAAQRV